VDHDAPHDGNQLLGGLLLGLFDYEGVLVLGLDTPLRMSRLVCILFELAVYRDNRFR